MNDDMATITISRETLSHLKGLLIGEIREKEKAIKTISNDKLKKLYTERLEMHKKALEELQEYV